MNKNRYIGCARWNYCLPAIPSSKNGVVEITIPSGNYKEDEGFARYLIRKQLGLKRLPKNSRVWPEYPIS